MSEFQLDPRLVEGSEWVADLALCAVRLKNDVRFPWLILVPRRSDIREVYELDSDDQRLVWEETTRMGEILMNECGGEKLNIGALGNLVPQLHLHAICRHAGDAAWPGPVWGVGTSEPYDAEAFASLIGRLRERIG